MCHEVVDGGRAAFRHSLVVFLPLPRDQILTTIGIRGGRGVVIGGHGVSRPLVSVQEKQRHHSPSLTSHIPCLSWLYVSLEFYPDAQ